MPPCTYVLPARSFIGVVDEVRVLVRYSVPAIHTIIFIHDYLELKRALEDMAVHAALAIHLHPSHPSHPFLNRTRLYTYYCRHQRAVRATQRLPPEDIRPRQLRSNSSLEFPESVGGDRLAGSRPPVPAVGRAGIYRILLVELISSKGSELGHGSNARNQLPVAVIFSTLLSYIRLKSYSGWDGWLLEIRGPRGSGQKGVCLHPGSM
ncbi:hypothetical protein B0T24DRAFT_639943 [Lasiosphaeria ovina]|uniref:Uncharacterized protein n=1 Tax=Lasiosphaeria ovina TaxID=92902 RepID=A0AAE0JVQ9_9PEZI|nr:hypothetical protein B0T24DRAFT_639943 [Lasiosphaeria ovina]